MLKIKNKFIKNKHKNNFIFNYFFKGELGNDNFRYNERTFEKLIRSINFFVESRNLEKKYLITFSNYLNEKESFLLDFFLKSKDLELYSTENKLSSIGLNSKIMKNENFTLNIHIENNFNFLRIFLLDKDGKNLSIKELDEIIRKYEEFEFKNEFSDLILNEINFLENNYLEEYKKELKNDFFIINKISQMNSEKILINLNSDFNDIILKEIYYNLNFKSIYFLNKRSVDQIEETKSFNYAYKFSNSNKIKNIINISPSGDKFSFASKKGKVWKFYKSTEIFILLINFISKILKQTSDYYINENSIKYIKKIAKKKSISLSNNPNIITDDNFGFLIKDKNTDVYDSLKSFKFLVWSVFFFDSINNELNNIFNSHGFFYSKYKVLETEFKYENFIKNNLDETLIKKINLLSNNDHFVEFEVNTIYGFTKISYNKFTKKIELYSYSYNLSSDEAFYNNRLLEKEVLKSLGVEKKENIFETRKGQIRLFILFLVFIFIMSSVLYSLFGNSILTNSFFVLISSYNKIWFYFLMSYLVLFPIFNSIIFFLLFKKINQNVKYHHIYLSFIFTSFISKISPSYLFGTAGSIWYLRKKGYKSSEIVPTIMLFFVIGGIFNMFITFFVLLSSTSLIINETIKFDSLQKSFYLLFMWIGFTWVSFSLFWIILISFSKKIHNFIFFIIERFLFKFKLEKKYVKINDELDFNATKIRFNLLKFLNNKILFFVIFVLIFSNYIFSSIVTASSFNIILSESDELNPIYNFLYFIPINSSITYINIISPIPGQSLTTEYVMMDFYSSFLSTLFGDQSSNYENYSKEISFLNRLFSYYGIVLLTIIPSFSILINNSRKSKNIHRNKEII